MRRTLSDSRGAVRRGRTRAGRSGAAAGARRSLLLPLLIGGLALFVLGIGYLAANGRELILMSLFVALPVLVLALRFFEHLVLTIPFVALLVRFSLPTGSDTRVTAVMLLVLLLAGIWVSVVVRQRSLRLVPSLLNGPLLCFMAVCCIALVWSIAFRDPLLMRYDRFALVQLGACAAMVLSPVATLLIANFVRTSEQLRWVGLVFVGVGVVATVLHLTGLRQIEINTGGLFSLWFIAVSSALVLTQPGLPLWTRIALGVVLLIHIYDRLVVGITWLSGWVPGLVALVVITWLCSKRVWAVLVLALVLLSVTQAEFIQTNVFEEAERDGSYERLALWELSFELLQEHPVVGTGPAGYALYYVTYHPEEARSTHNNYLDIIAQTGVLGTLCWLWLMLAAARETRLVLRHAPPGWLRTLAVATAGGLVGAAVAMMLGDWVLPFAYNQGVAGYRYTVFSWIFLGVLISVRQQVVPQTASAPVREASLLIERRARLARIAAARTARREQR